MKGQGERDEETGEGEKGKAEKLLNQDKTG